MILEEQRFLHEDLERLEQGIADRVAEDPRNIQERLYRDHQIAGFLSRIQNQSERLLSIYTDAEGSRQREIQAISTGDPFDEFYKHIDEIKDFHRRYPNEPAENLEKAYKKKAQGETDLMAAEVMNMFTGEEAFGRFLDLTTLHEEYLNLVGVKRLTYLQYLDAFDIFVPPQCPIKRVDKATDQYFGYVGRLASYFESFLKRTRPLEDLDKIFRDFDTGFEKAWASQDLPGWAPEVKVAGPQTSTEGIWCPDCEKLFTNDNVYKNHLTGKKHLRNAEARGEREDSGTNGHVNGGSRGNNTALRLKERAIAEREFRVRKLSYVLSEVKSNTRVNVERKQGMTERERQMELDALFAETADVNLGGHGEGEDSDSDEDEKIYNPLKLPLAWDGKPIPYWLYKLHGLGVEFPCEICGNFVYMGRRAFDKHFTEARHIYGLKCLGITNTSLFREITGIEDALKLWDKIQRDKRKERAQGDSVVEMEDTRGNVMPEKIYHDLQKQGLL